MLVRPGLEPATPAWQTSALPTELTRRQQTGNIHSDKKEKGNIHTSRNVCFATCWRWLFICKANSLVGVIIKANSGLSFLSLSMLLPASADDVSETSTFSSFSFSLSVSWTTLWCKMWVIIGMPKARVFPEP